MFPSTYDMNGIVSTHMEQFVTGHIKNLCNNRDHSQIRRAVTPFPTANCFIRNIQSFSQIFLGHPVAFYQKREIH